MTDDFEANEAFEAATTPGPTRWQQYLAGTLTVDDWDDDEVARGQMRGRDGRFHGNPPKKVPTELHRAWQARLRAGVQTRIEKSAYDAADHLTAVVRGEEPPNADRIRAAALVLDRVLGKTADRVDVTVAEAAPWQRLFTRIARELPASEQVVDAEVVVERDAAL